MHASPLWSSVRVVRTVHECVFIELATCANLCKIVRSYLCPSWGRCGVSYLSAIRSHLVSIHAPLITKIITVTRFPSCTKSARGGRAGVMRLSLSSVTLLSLPIHVADSWMHLCLCRKHHSNTWSLGGKNIDSIHLEDLSGLRDSMKLIYQFP